MMTRLFRSFRALFVLGALLLGMGAMAAPLAPGAVFPVLNLEDQHGKVLAVPAGTRVVLFAADKTASDLANSLLAAQPAGVLDRLQAAYLADISAMPAVITRMFALPALRALPFRVGLARDASLLADVPRQRGAVSVIRLSEGRVDRIDFASDEVQLRSALGLQ